MRYSKIDLDPLGEGYIDDDTRVEAPDEPDELPEEERPTLEWTRPITIVADFRGRHSELEDTIVCPCPPPPVRR